MKARGATPVWTRESELTAVPGACMGAALAPTLHAGRAELVEEPPFSRGMGWALDVAAISHLLSSLSRKGHPAART